MQASSRLPPLFKALTIRLSQETHETDFFTALARHAREKGHGVYWLETPAAFHAGHARFNASKEELLKSLFKSRRLWLLKIARIARLEMQSATKGLQLAKWRSSIMARRMLSREWKPTDVAFVGGFHAEHLRKVEGARVEQLPKGVERAMGKVTTVFDAVFSRPFEASRSARKAAWRLWKKLTPSRRTPSTPRASPR